VTFVQRDSFYHLYASTYAQLKKKKEQFLTINKYLQLGRYVKRRQYNGCTVEKDALV